LSFLGKHYEKIILAVFLLIFIVSLVYLITVFSKSKETTEEDLRVVIRKADYSQKFNEVGTENITGGQKEKYATLENLTKAQSWNRPENRNPDSPVSTELLVPFKAARCPGCKKIVPLVYFEREGPCPLCKFSLKKPDPPKIKTGEQEDNDNDGMSNMFERQNELNLEDASDKMADKDEDGYPNFIEFKAETKVNDAKSHPPIADRLSLVSIKRKKLPLQLWNVLSRGKEDKAKWLIQIKVLDKRKRWKSEFPKLNATLKLGKGLYKIIDVIYKTKEKFDKKLGAPKITNISEIIIQNTVNKSDKPITVQMKKKVYENLARITLKDYYTDKIYHLKIGDTFTTGDSDIGVEKYTIVSIDKTEDKKNAIAIKDEKGNKYIISRKSALETKIDAINEADGKKPARRAPNEFDPRGMGMDLPPGRIPTTKRRERFPSKR
jgi:hypothetical protein